MRLQFIGERRDKDIDEIQGSIVENYFPPALRNTENNTSNIIVNELLDYFTYPLAEYVTILNAQFPIRDLESGSIGILEEVYMSMLQFPNIERFIDLLTYIEGFVVRPEDVEGYWIVPDTEYFQATLPIMPSNFYEAIRISEFLTGGDISGNYNYCLTFGWSGFTSPNYTTQTEEPIGVYDNANN